MRGCVNSKAAIRLVSSQNGQGAVRRGSEALQIAIRTEAGGVREALQHREKPERAARLSDRPRLGS